jgi:hypothetical protein
VPATPDLAPSDELAGPRATRRAASADRFTASVTHLLDVREDLHGVAAMADLIYDAVRWSA